MSRFRGLLVDYGGVLTSSISTSFARFCLETGVSPERFKEVLAVAYHRSVAPAPRTEDLRAAWADGGLVAAVETGRIGHTEFERRLAEALSDGLPAPLDPVGLGLRLFGELTPDRAMRDAVAAARARGVATAVVTNTWGPMPDAEQAELDRLFDAVIRSDVERVRKPDPAIYRLAADRVGVEPAACVFVDDIPANVDGARAVGMEGVVHRDAAITIPKLEGLFGLALTTAQDPAD